MTYVCITGNEQSPSALLSRVESVLQKYPRVLCEARLDFLDLSPAHAFGFLARIPPEMASRMILTQRLKASGPEAGGHCTWDIFTWQSWWRDVMALRAWYAVDLDWIVLDRLTGDSLEWRGKLRARHAFFSLHSSLKEIGSQLPALLGVAKELEAGVKLAVPVQTMADLVRLEKISTSLDEALFKIVVAMGATGRVWRWSQLAGHISYFAAQPSRVTAAGQDSLEDVGPYLKYRKRPNLYALLGDDAENRYGEKRWNRIFFSRGAECRYLNFPQADEPGREWRDQCLSWMQKAKVEGASVTKPFKLCFDSPTNTLWQEKGEWQTNNTDGSAVVKLLNRAGIKSGSRIVIAGSGGAAQGVREALLVAGYSVTLWSRQGGVLEKCPEGDALISTWPAPFQRTLVDALPAESDFKLVIDSQLQWKAYEAPLGFWAHKQTIEYLSGAHWWREQARGQDLLWFGKDRLGKAKDEILIHIPHSKSESIRALAISLAFGTRTKVEGIANNEDTNFFLAAMEKLGFHVDHLGNLLEIFPPKDISPPEAVIDMGAKATRLRFLVALSSLMKGNPLLLQSSEDLQGRPQGDFSSYLGNSLNWPLGVEVGQDIPFSISMEKSSQFASALLIAGAGKIVRGEKKNYTLTLEGEIRSRPYLELSLAFLRLAGIEYEWKENIIALRLGKKQERLHFKVEKDASSLSFFEVAAWVMDLEYFGSTQSRQGDSSIVLFLTKLGAGQSLSLRDHPDLAPPLWAAAALARKNIRVIHTPHLQWKESNRAQALVDLSLELGVESVATEDGFVANFENWKGVRGAVELDSKGDHRIAMAIALLQLENNEIKPSSPECVAKSFPDFWLAWEKFKKSLHILES